MNDYALFDQLMGASAPAAPYAPYGLDEWGNPLPEPQIPSAIQTTAPVAQQAQRDYTQAITAAFDWTPPAPTLPALPEMQGASYSPVGNAAANLTAQFGEDTNTFDGAQQPFDPWAALLQFEQAGTGARSSGLESYGGDFNAAAPASSRGVTQLQLQQTLSDIGRAEQAGTISPAEAQRQYENVMGRSTPTGLNVDPYPLAGKAVGAGLDVLGDIVNGKYIQGYTGVAGQGAIGPAPARAPMSAKDVYNIADMPSDIAKQQAIKLIGDNPYGRIAGEALNIGLAPETLASLGIAGASPLANAIGRGSMKTAPYLTSLVGSQVANDIAREAGAPMPVQIGASVLGAIGGAGIPAAGRLGIAGAKAGVEEAGARAAASGTLNRALPANILTQPRLNAAMAARVGVDPTQAARQAISGEYRAGIAGAADETAERLRALNGLAATKRTPEATAAYAAQHGVEIPPELLNKNGSPIAARVRAWAATEAEQLKAQGVEAALPPAPASAISPQGVTSPPVGDTPAPVRGRGFLDDLAQRVDDERRAAWRESGGDIERAALQHIDDISGRSAGAPDIRDVARGERQQAWQAEARRLAAEAEQRVPQVATGGGAQPPVPPRPGAADPDFDPEQWRENLARYKSEGDPFTDIKPKSLPRKIAENLLAIPSAWKATQASGDVLGGSGRQLLPVWFAETRAAAKGMGKGWEAYFTDPDSYDILKAMGDIPMFRGGQVTTKSGKLIDIPAMADVMNLNSWQTPGFELINDSAVARWSRNFPLLKRGDHALRANMVAAAADARSRWIKQAIDAGIEDPAWFKFYDDTARVMVGAGDVPKWARAISNSFYSLQNLAARAQTFTKPFTSPGPVLRSPGKMVRDKAIFSASPRGVASRNLTRFMAGEMANLNILAAAGQTSGLFSVGANPLGPGFGRLEFDDENGNTYSIDLLGGYGSLIKTVTRASDGLVNPDSKYDPAGEVLTFFRNKTAPATSLLVDTALATLPATKDSEIYKSPWSVNLLDPKTWTTRDGAAALIERTLPFWAGETTSALVRGVYDGTDPKDLLKAGSMMMGQLIGVPSSLFPATPSESLEAAANKLNPAIPWAEMGRAEKREFVMQNPSLTDKWQAAEAAREGESVRLQRERDAALDRIAPLATNDPEAYRAKVSDIIGDYNTNREYAIEKGIIKPWGEPESELGKAMDGFYKAADEARTIAGTDYDLREKLTSDYLATLSPEMRERVLKELTFATEPHYGALLRDRQVITPYWEIRDNAWRNLAATNEIFAGSTSEESWRATKIAQEMADGRSEEIATKIADAFINAYAAQAKVEQIMYLYNNRDVLVLLDRWGYSIPTGLTALLPYYAQQLRGTTPEQRQFEMAGQR